MQIYKIGFCIKGLDALDLRSAGYAGLRSAYDNIDR